MLRAVLGFPIILLLKATINFGTGHLDCSVINTTFSLVM